MSASRSSGHGVASSQSSLFRRHTQGVVTATGIVFFVGTTIDFLVLWIFQRGGGLQWEFVAATQTAEGIPRMMLGFGLIYLGLFLKGSPSVAMYRFLALGVLFLGLCSLALGVVITLNYLSISGAVAPEAAGAFRSTSIKSMSLVFLYVVTLIPLGVLGFRVPKTRV